MVDFPNESGPTRNQRGSLRQVNETLLGQNEILVDTQSRVETTNDILRKSLEEQSELFTMRRLDKLEDKREKDKGSTGPGLGGRLASGITGGAAATSQGIQNMLRNIAGLLTPAALAALPGILGRTLLTRGIPALAIGVFADEIADFLLGPDVEKELKDQVSRAIQGGALGSLLGRRFAVIGAAAGFLIDEEVQAQLLELGKSFATMFGEDVESVEDLKALAMKIGTFLRETLKSGLEGINLLLNGEIKEFFGIGEGENKVLSTLGLLTSLGLLISPRGTVGAAILTAKTLWGGAKLLSSITGLTALGNSLVGAAPATAADADAARKDKKSGKDTAKKVARTGRAGSAFRVVGGALVASAGFLGPAAVPILGVAAIAGLAVAAMQTQTGKSFLQNYVLGEKFQETDVRIQSRLDKIQEEKDRIARSQAGVNEYYFDEEQGIKGSRTRIRRLEEEIEEIQPGFLADTASRRELENEFSGVNTGQTLPTAPIMLADDPSLVVPNRISENPTVDKFSPVPNRTADILIDDARAARRDNRNVNINAPQDSSTTINAPSTTAISMPVTPPSTPDAYQQGVEMR